MPPYGTVTNLRHTKVAGQTQCRVAVPVVLHPAPLKDQRANVPVGVCLATNEAGGSRRLSQAARDYAAGAHVLKVQFTGSRNGHSSTFCLCVCRSAKRY